jgi:hypothetical protein
VCVSVCVCDSASRQLVERRVADGLFTTMFTTLLTTQLAVSKLALQG